MDVPRDHKERRAARLTIEDAALTLGIKEESVRKRVRRGKMRFQKGGWSALRVRGRYRGGWG